MTTNLTSQEQRLVRMAAAVGELIHDIKEEVSSGHLYAQLMGHVSLEEYNVIIRTLENAKLVEEKNNLLRWIGEVK